MNQHERFFSRGVLVALCLMFLFFAPVTGHAATFTVNSTADTAGLQANCVNGAADCTLRSAVQAANASVGVDDTIILPAGTFTLTLGGAGEDLAATGDLDIGDGVGASSLTIIGQGETLTIIDGDNADRVFETITDGTSVTISLVTIRNGNSAAGGCILTGNGTSIILNDVVVTGCIAADGGGGIDNSGNLTMNVVSVTTNTSPGGAINNGTNGAITWIDGELSNNSGGGINNSAANSTLSLTNVTISGNTTAESGAGIDNRGTVILRNVTISNNTAPAPNIGGLRNRNDVEPTATATVTNTIISGNLSANCGGTITSGGNNIDNGTTCGFGVATDPLLGALALNGGKLRTHALGIGSPAIDAGNPAVCLDHDARKLPRPVDGNPLPPAVTAVCDVGAFEFRPRKITISPASPFNFGTVTSGTTSDQIVTITNGGDAPLLPGAIAVADALAAPFTLPVNGCTGVTLAPAASCALTVRFSPASTAAATDTFSIPSNDPLTPTVTFTVSGTGTENLVSNIAVTDSVAPADDHVVSFGGVAVGATSDATITITSGGAAALVIGTIGSIDPLAAPFSITSNTCSNQAIAPTQTCTLTVRFSPTINAASSDTFDILNNDPDTPTITITLTGSGVSATGNNPPSVPILTSPANGAIVVGTSVTLAWNQSVDPDGDAVTYHVSNCANQDFTGCAPVDVASAGASGLMYAGMGSLGAGVIMIGFVFGSGFNRSRKALLMIAAVFLTGALFMSCSSSDDDGPAPPAGAQLTVSGLTTGTTYFWKVVADDGRGGTSTSEVRSYTTQ